MKRAMPGKSGLGIPRVIAEHSHGFVAVPEAHEAHLGIDHALRLRAQCRILRRGVTNRAHAAIGSENAPVRGHAFHLRDTPADLRDRLRRAQRIVQCRRGALHHAACEAAIPAAGGPPRIAQQRLGAEIHGRRIVLVQSVDRDPARLGPGSTRERRAKGVVRFIADADPIHRAEHDRRARAQQRDPTAAQRQLIHALDWIVSHLSPDRRRRIHVKGRQPQRLGSGQRRDGENGGEEESHECAQIAEMGWKKSHGGRTSAASCRSLPGQAAFLFIVP